MKVIFKRNYKTFKKGSIEEVSDGFANNFLIPKNIVIKATHDNLSIFNRDKERDEKSKMEITELSERNKEILESQTFIFEANVTPKGLMNGSFSKSAFIYLIFSYTSIKIDKKSIDFKKINTFGEHIITVTLSTGIKAKVKLNIKSV